MTHVFKRNILLQNTQDTFHHGRLRWNTTKEKCTIHNSWRNLWTVEKRVLGDTVENVVLYVPTRPANQTKISTLQDLADAEHLEKIFFVLGKEKENQKKSAINEATENAINKTEQLYAGLPKKDLEDILEELDDKLEPSVAEFLNRFVNATTPNIDTRDLILDLIKAYNETVIQYRKKTTTA